MGLATSKLEKDEALRLCKEHKRFIRQAIDSRYNLAAAHVSYIQSLRGIGSALKHYAEVELCVAAENGPDKTPLNSSYHPSPSPSQNVEGFRSPSLGFSRQTVNCMRSSGNGGVLTMKFSPARSGFVDEEEERIGFSLPPPPPPLPGVGGESWDYFDTSESIESRHFGNESGLVQNGSENVELKKVENELVVSEDGGGVRKEKESSSGGGVEEEEGKVEERVSGEREDPAEYITHRAKDFMSSIRDIEHRFVRASEAGREVCRLLETNKIQRGYSEAKGSVDVLK